MRWSIHAARVAGIEIRIHLTFLLLLAGVGIGYHARGGMPAALAGLAFVLLLFGSVVLHELGHAVAALRYGIHTPDITLLPIGGVARLERLPRDPRQELAVALAGPAVTALIALGLTLAAGSGAGATEPLQALDDPGHGLAAQLRDANLVLLAFNLLPAFPMDGGRVLRAGLALRMDYVRATRIAARAGRAFAFVFGLVGLLFNPFLVLVALFVFLGATQEAAATEVQELSRRLPISAAMLTEFRSLREDATLEEAADALLRTSQHDFPVVDGAMRPRGVLTRAALVEGLGRGGAGLPVGSAMRTGVVSVGWRTPLEEAVQRMQSGRLPLVAVTGDDGALVGLITPENLGEVLMVHEALARAPRTAPVAPAGR